MQVLNKEQAKIRFFVHKCSARSLNPPINKF